MGGVAEQTSGMAVRVSGFSGSQAFGVWYTFNRLEKSQLLDSA